MNTPNNPAPRGANTDANAGVARHGDPATSREAPAGGAYCERLRWAILNLLDDTWIALYDDEIVASLGDLVRTESGVQTRRRELVDLGLVAAVGHAFNSRNRRVTVWAATGQGHEVLRLGDPRLVTRRFAEWNRQRAVTDTPIPMLRLRQTVADLQQEVMEANSLLRHLVVGLRSADPELIQATLGRASTWLDRA